MKLLLILASFFCFSTLAQEGAKKDSKIIYKYRKFQKFDFEDLVIEGESGAPGDLSLGTRYQRKYKNRLPYRKNFNAEIRKGIERIR